MSSSILQINVKPNTPGEAGLPKIAIDSAEISFLGVEGDYNRFRFNKKKKWPWNGHYAYIYGYIKGFK